MKFIPYILILLCFGNTNVAAQSKGEIIGDRSAIILDLEIDEGEKSIIASTPEDVQKWNYEAKVLINRWSFSNVQDLDKFGNFIAGVSKSGELFVWNPQQNDAGSEFKITPEPLNCVIWIDSVWIAVGSNDGMIYKVNSYTGEIQKSIKSKGSVTSMAMSKNGVLAGNSIGEIVMYSANEFVPKKFIKAHKNWVRDIQVIDSTETFVTVADDGKLKRWTSEFGLVTEVNYQGWLISVDFIDNKKSNIFTVGKLNGEFLIQTRFGRYVSKANASISKIILFRECLPYLKGVAATHGGGIQLWDVKLMKLKTN